MYILIIFVLIVGGFAYFVNVNNDIIKRKNRIDNAWSQIDVQLKRRFDAIPNLVEIVKGYAKHESETFLKVISARDKFTSATSIPDKIEADKELSGALNRLIAITESYPELKANQNFLQLQGELVKIEDKIAFSRQFYNDTVLLNNNAIEVFPGSIIADSKGYKPGTYYEIDEADKENPKIQF